MANTAVDTLAGVLKLGDANVDFEVSDLLQETPVLQVLAAVESTHGHLHKYNKETVAATAAFRAAGTGVLNTAGQIDTITETLKFLDASWEADIAIGKAMSGRKGGLDAWVEQQGKRSLKAAFVAAEKQVIYGDQTPGSTDGYTGIVDAVVTAMKFNGGGDTADKQTSVYAIRTGEEDFAMVYNSEDEGLIDMQDVRIVRIATTDGKSYDAYRETIASYLATQIGSQFTLARLANLHPTDTDAQLDDDKIAAMLAGFPAGRGPTHLVMNKKAQEMLRQSRTATNATGAPAPLPTEAFGIPIVVTDSVVSTEAVVSFA